VTNRLYQLKKAAFPNVPGAINDCLQKTLSFSITIRSWQKKILKRARLRSIFEIAKTDQPFAEIQVRKAD